MNNKNIKVIWPNGKSSMVPKGTDWLSIANKAGVIIPTGCLNGSCGACEIEVNGQIVRACINSVPSCKSKILIVKFITDPFW